MSPVSSLIVNDIPSVTNSPDAVLISPPVGTESTVMERVSPVSGSVGAEIFNSVASASSSSVTVESAAATGERFAGEGLVIGPPPPPPPPQALKVREISDGMTMLPFWLRFFD